MKRLIIFCMTLLGFGAVSCEGGGNLDAYGTPYTDYKISLRVVNSDGNPIPVIGISIANGIYEVPFATSGLDGRVDSKYRSLGAEPEQLLFEDIDGIENGGEFESLAVDITDKAVKVSDNDPQGWSRGEYVIALGDITLERKSDSSNQE